MDVISWWLVTHHGLHLSTKKRGAPTILHCSSVITQADRCCKRIVMSLFALRDASGVRSACLEVQRPGQVSSLLLILVPHGLA